MDKSRQEKLEARRREENAVFNRMLIWLGGALIYEVLILALGRFFIDYSHTDIAEIRLAQGIGNVLGALRFIAPALAVAAVVWAVLWFRKGRSVLVPGVCALASAALGVTALVAYHYRELGMAALELVAPAGAILIAIFFLYQRDFFYSALLTGAGLAALWVYREAYWDHPRMIYFGFALVWIGLIAAVVLAWKLSRSKGRLGKVKILEPGAAYPMICLSAGLSALALVLALLLGMTVAYYAIFGLIAWLFCMAVYSTVRLM